MLLNPGTVLGDRYEIIEKIGSGGMAVVYRGKDRKLDRYVTIKVLREEFIGDEEFIERFRSEACSAARLSHPNIVRVYDVGEDGEINYIVMEYIHGDTLKTAIKKKAPFDSRSTSMWRFRLRQRFLRRIKRILYIETSRHRIFW